MNTIECAYENEDGEEVVLTLPAKMEVCGDCEGEGYVLREGMRGHAYSAEEFAEAFDDEDREEYFRRAVSMMWFARLAKDVTWFR